VSAPNVNIMIVEDNLAHLKITEYILRQRNVEGNFIVVRDGQEVLDYLYHRGLYVDGAKHPNPNLILLDFNLPQRDGREVLKIIKEDPALKNIPVVIVSTSDREEDLTYARQNGAVAYISKSSGFENFKEELGNVGKYVAKY
jgi:CheY-like chemotaxis protein